MIERISKEEFDVKLQEGKLYTLESFGTMQIDESTKEAAVQPREGYLKDADGNVIAVILL
jgi:hypothetical protein